MIHHENKKIAGNKARRNVRRNSKIPFVIIHPATYAYKPTNAVVAILLMSFRSTAHVSQMTGKRTSMYTKLV